MTTRTFTTIVDLYDDKEVLNEANEVIGVEQVLIKKDIKLKVNVILSDIKRYEQVVNDNGNIKHKTTKLILSDGNAIMVNESFNEIHNLLKEKQIGFQYGRK